MSTIHLFIFHRKEVFIKEIHWRTLLTILESNSRKEILNKIHTLINVNNNQEGDRKSTQPPSHFYIDSGYIIIDFDISMFLSNQIAFKIPNSYSKDFTKFYHVV